MKGKMSSTKVKKISSHIILDTRHVFFQEQTVSSCYHYLFIVQTMILRSLISHVILYRKKWSHFSEILKLARAYQCLLTNYHIVTTLLKIDSVSFLCIGRHIKICIEMILKLQEFILKLFDYFFSQILWFL